MFFSRLLPIVRTFISFPAGVARMPIGPFIVYSTAGAFLWSILLVYAGTVLGANWVDIRHALQPFDLADRGRVSSSPSSLFIWWRLGMPGRPRPGAKAQRAAAQTVAGRALLGRPHRAERRGTCSRS